MLSINNHPFGPQEASEINPVVKRGEEKLFKLYDANKDGMKAVTRAGQHRASVGAVWHRAVKRAV